MEHSERQHDVEENPLLLTDKIMKEWTKEVKQYMDDEDLTECLDLVIKVIAKPNVPRDKVAVLITQLSAYSIKFRLMFSAHMSYKKGTTEANMKKNHYKELYTGIDNLVDALKYLLK